MRITPGRKASARIRLRGPGGLTAAVKATSPRVPTGQTHYRVAAKAAGISRPSTGMSSSEGINGTVMFPETARSSR